MIILDGKQVAFYISKTLTKKIAMLNKKPTMKIVQVGSNYASNKYVAFKLKKAKELGIEITKISCDENISQQDITDKILYELKNTDGMIIQLPLPNHLDQRTILDLIPHEKDIDGLAFGNDKIIPATPRGILSLLFAYGIEVKNKNVAVVGQSNLVGKPVANQLKILGANVIAYTEDTTIKGTEKADIIIVAVGKRGLIKKENIKKGVVIIDVGINTFSNGKITGDVDRESVQEIPSAISPVPGGVGPMTIISLFENLYDQLTNK